MISLFLVAAFLVLLLPSVHLAPMKDTAGTLFAPCSQAQEAVDTNPEETTVLSVRFNRSSATLALYKKPTSFQFRDTGNISLNRCRVLQLLSDRSGCVAIVGPRRDVSWAQRLVRSIESDHLQEVASPLSAELCALRLAETVTDASAKVTERLPAINAIVVAPTGRLLKVDLSGTVLDCKVASYNHRF